MDQQPPAEETGEEHRRPATDPDGAERLEALERQVRQLMGRLAAWVEGQLVQAVEDRRGDLRALRSELRTALGEQVAGARAESASVISVAVRRLTVDQQQLGERLADVAGRSTEAVAVTAALAESATADAGRLEALEQQVADRISRLTESVQARLVDAAERRASEMERMSAELATALGERLHDLAGRAAETAAGLAAVSSVVEAEAARVATFEERVRAAVAHLTESLDEHVAETAASRRTDAEDQRGQWQAAIAAARDGLQDALDQGLQEIAAEASLATAGVGALTATVQADQARAETFDELVRTAVSRLSESTERRLAEIVTGRQSALDDLEASLTERWEAASRQASGDVAGLAASVEAESARLNAFEEQVRAVISRLTESVEAVVTTSATRPKELAALRAELQAAVDQRLQAIAGHVTANVADLTAEVEAQASRFDAFEERVRSAVTEITESLTRRLTETESDRDGEIVALRARLAEGMAAVASSLEAGTATTEAREARMRSAIGRVAQSVEQRLTEATADRRTEQQAIQAGLDADLTEHVADHVGELVDARLADLVERRRTEFESLQLELQDALTRQLTEARSQIASAVAGANKRFVRGLEQLAERTGAVAERATRSSEKVDVLAEAIASETRRLEALEAHAGAADDRMVQLVSAKISEAMSADADARIAALRTELEASLSARVREVRGQIASSAAATEAKLVAAGDGIEGRVTEVANRVTTAAARLASVTSSMTADRGRLDRLERRARQSDERLAKAMETRLAASAEARAAEVAALSADLAEFRSVLATAVAAQTRRSTRAQEQLKRGLDDMAGRIEELVVAMAAAASAEKGALAPLRSDVRMLQTQVAELLPASGEARSRRRRAAPAPVAKAVPVAKRASRATKDPR